MLKFQSKHFATSALYALNGLRLAFKSQRNFRKHLLISLSYLVISLALKFPLIEICLIILASSVTLAFELVNSCIEFIMDAYYKNKWAKLAKLAKDMCAGAVLLLSLTTCAMVIIFCIEKIFKLYF